VSHRQTLRRALSRTSDKEPENEEGNGEDTKGKAGYLVPVGYPSVSLWFGLELAGLDDSLHNLMAEAVLIVEVLTLLWSAKVGEVVLFLFVHFVLFLVDWWGGCPPRWLLLEHQFEFFDFLFPFLDFLVHCLVSAI